MISKVSQVAMAAKDYGVLSTFQLSVFLQCAEKQGLGVFDIFGVEPGNPEYSTYYGAIRQLMLGASNRGYNGANVLCWGDKLRGKERALLLTPKGRRFLKVIQETLGS
ncbi:hypothetical protein PU634_10480 [Oceanimonas pelagia]|uniref:Uncharacterized protein n=1 Tax=Oceanimonas pelagia TaxID=3028314 RepID=A0AA50KMB3_9GAMM|nr:hypothetical protein [Oceanimonas pelagia]WMC09542.1 hypothetical protein PU634_10480 [Oceanimonas pelagia]